MHVNTLLTSVVSASFEARDWNSRFVSTLNRRISMCEVAAVSAAASASVLTRPASRMRLPPPVRLVPRSGVTNSTDLPMVRKR